MTSTTSALSELFSPSETDNIPSGIAQELVRDERVAWIGGPSRWGLFRVTPFVFIGVGLSVVLTYLSSGSGTSPWYYLISIASVQTGINALILPGLLAAGLVFLGMALRDPRRRWTYVVTDRRLMTFYKGRKLREAGIDRLERLQVIRGLEGRIRGIGDIVWARLRKERNSEGRGPDHGLHGFRGMEDPERWKARLLEWRQAVRSHAVRDAKEFEQRAASHAAPAPPGSGMRRVANNRFGFSITLPEHWVGRIGLQERARLRILGLELPVQKVRQSSNEPLHKPPESWNFISVSGRSGMKFRINVNPGPPVATFETSRDKVGRSLIEADGKWRCGPLTGYRVDYRYLDTLFCRFAMLAGDGFHMLINVTVPPDQADDLLPALNAAFGSIREA